MNTDQKLPEAEISTSVATPRKTRRPGWLTRDRAALVAAAAGPFAVAAVLTPWLDSPMRTDAALVVVLVVVAIAANGHRIAGLIAAVSAAVWFDVLLTRPYGRLTINDTADVQTTVLLLLVGITVTELAVWGRRQHAEVSRQEGYEAGIRDAARALGVDASPTSTVDTVASQLTRLLHLQSCRFDYGTEVLGGRPRLRPDGQVEVAGVIYDVDKLGQPTGQEIDLLVTNGPRYHGCFLMIVGPTSRPSLAQRLVAVALAERTGAALAGEPNR
jgi:K+-sensing histidine kinase KdpD